MTDILSSLPIRDGLLLALVPAQRSLLDLSGLGHILTHTGEWARRGGVDGLVMGSAGLISTPHAADLSGFAGYSCFVAGAFKPTVNGVLMRKTGPTGRIHFYTNATQLATYDGTSASVLACDIAALRSVGVSVAGGGLPEFFGDGASLGFGSGVITVPATDQIMAMLGTPASTPHARAFLFYSETKTAEEWALLHEWSESLTSPVIAQDRRHFDMGSTVPNGDSGGVVASYDLGTVHNRSVADSSGGGSHGDVIGGCAPVFTEAGRALGFDGASGYVEVTAGWETEINGSDEFSFSAMVRIPAFNGHNHRLFASTEGQNLAITVTSVGGIQVFLKTSVTGWSSVDASGSFIEGVFHLVTVTYTSGALKIFVNGNVVLDSAAFTGALSFVSSSLLLGVNSSRNSHWYEGHYVWAMVHNRALTSAEIKADYPKLARRVMFDSALELIRPTIRAYVAGEMIPGTDYRVESGSHSVLEDPATGEHFIECATSGVYSRRNNLADGTWRFGFIKVAASALFFSPIASVSDVYTAPGQNGYILYVDSSQKFRFKRVDSGVLTTLFITATGYIDADTKYEIVITRRTGVFAVYIRGGVWSNWVLMTATSGTNPTAPDTTYSDSAHIVYQVNTGVGIYLDRQLLGECQP